MRSSGPKNFKQRRPDGKDGWIWNIEGVRRVLYRLPRIKDASFVVVVEGEKDVRTAEELGLIATCNPMGAGHWQPSYSQSLKGKRVWIVADADEKGRRHAANIAQDLRDLCSEVVIIELPNAKDISDWVSQGGTRRQFEELGLMARNGTATSATKTARTITADGPSQDATEQTAVPNTFELFDGDAERPPGLYKLVFSGDEIRTIYLSGRLEVLALTRDMRGECWGKHLRFCDPDGRVHEFTMSETLLASRQGEWLAQLKARGLFVSPQKEVRGHLQTYLSLALPSARIRTVSQVGWHDNVFVTPTWTVPSETPERIVLDDLTSGQHLFEQRGTLQQWRTAVSSLCKGNSLLVFALSASFAPILLPLKPGLSGGFHLASNTSTGKTTALIAAGSVWGGGGQLGFVQSWNATANGIEATAQLHNNVLLALDELKELPADHAGRIAYQLANGQGRATMDRNRARRHRQTWSLIFLSSGEFGFTTHILASEKRVYAGQEVRCAKYPPIGAPSERSIVSTLPPMRALLHRFWRRGQCETSAAPYRLLSLNI